MSTSPLSLSARNCPLRTRAFGAAGSPGARVLAGPGEHAGAESLASHIRRLGSMPDRNGPEVWMKLLRSCGLRGRGGSSFPVARKLDAAAATGGNPLIVVNGSESEPASRKDATLLCLRPHLVIDGAVAVAKAVRSAQVIVVVHAGNSAARMALQNAIAERQATMGAQEPSLSVSVNPDRYVAGEASAIVSLLEGGPALPRFDRTPTAVSGVHGRPTLVHNAETAAHLGMAARFGVGWLAEAGSSLSPGTTLVTLVGTVPRPGQVLEVWGPATIGDLLRSEGWSGGAPRAVLLGGYAGSWIDGDDAWGTTVGRSASGPSLGCGLIGVLADDACGLRETARIMAYLAGESTGQCGPCAHGLPALASTLAAMHAGRASRADVRRLHHQAASIAGRGACRHPDAAVALLDTAFQVFADEIEAHRRWRCPAAGSHPVFPIPSGASEWS